MLYARGAASDYDDWSAFGNEGWSFEELLPCIRKIETYTPIPDRPTHGYSGPIQITAGGADFGIGKQLLDVAKEYDPVHPQIDDNNDFKSGNAYSPCYKYMDATGKRSDAASRYLYPHSGNANLTIVVGKRVKRIIVENGRAVGIEYTTDAKSPEGIRGELVTVKARKLTIVCAGAFGSPCILERSGIGGRSVLEKNNIRVVVDLPGVGENYQDHLGLCPVFYTTDETDSMDDVWSDPKPVAEYLQEWQDHGTGKIAHTGIEAIMKVRPTAGQLTSAGPALQARWESFFQSHPDKPVAIIAPFSGVPLDPGRSKLVGRKLFSVVFYILYPDSVGSVHIASGDDANSPADFDPDYFSKQSDIAEFNFLYKMTREYARRMPGYRGDMAGFHPAFPSGSAATCTQAAGPVPMDAPDIVYSDEDDKAIEKFTRDTVFTTWHSLGTCAMKPRDQGGVVDARLNVYGVEGLKVADLSICPSNVGNNTYSTALLVGEKAAMIIAEDLGVNMTADGK